MKTTARLVHACVALLSAAALVSSFYLGWTDGTNLPAGVGYAGGFSAGWEHALNQPAYFTVLSGLLVCVTSAMLAVRPERGSRIFHSLRLAGVVQMMITGLVFNILLRGDGELTGVSLFNDQVLHVILPVLVPVVWLLCGPHGRLSGHVVLGAAVVPLLWLAVTLIRGPLLDWYPYDILDVPGLGFGGVGVYIGAIMTAFMAIACLLWLIDRLFSGRARPTAPR